MSRIDVHIDALVLDRATSADPAAVAAALESELGRLVGEHGLPGVQRHDGRPVLPGGGRRQHGSEQATADPARAGAPGADALGAAAAAAIHGALAS